MSLFGELPRAVRVVEVGPRDGLQNEKVLVATDEKVRFIEALADAGHKCIEAAAFVSPQKVPAMADAEEVFRRLRQRPGVTYLALVPNEKGMERALRSGARAVAVFVGASDSFNQKNIGCTAAEALERFRPVAAAAMREGAALRAYLSTAFVCPYEGEIDPKRSSDLCRRLADLEPGSIAVSDTLGAAHPLQVDRLLDEIESTLGLERIALHLHDTRRRALANATVGLLRGIRELDGSAGGLGGCPFAPGAAGNLATEDLLSLLHAMGIETGVDEAKHAAATGLIRAALARGDPGKVGGRKSEVGRDEE